MSEAKDISHRRRSDAGCVQMIARDILSLRWIAEQDTIHTGQLALLLGQHAKATTKQQNRVTLSAVRHALERWHALNLIEDPYKFISTTPAYVWVSRRAIQELALPYPYYRPRLASLPHITHMNTLRLTTEEQDPKSTWLSERALRAIRCEIYADAELHTSTGYVFAVKVIDALQDVATFLAHIQLLLAHKSGVWCYCPAHLSHQLQEAIVTLDPVQRQRITIQGLPLPSILPHFPPSTAEPTSRTVQHDSA